jgi:uncharacterized membrane protein
MNDETRDRIAGGISLGLGLIGLLGSPLGRGDVKLFLFPEASTWLVAPVAWVFLGVQLAVAGLWYRNVRLVGAVAGIAGLIAALVWFDPWHMANPQMYQRYGLTAHRQAVMMGQAIAGLIVGAGFLRGWWLWRPGRDRQ